MPQVNLSIFGVLWVSSKISLAGHFYRLHADMQTKEKQCDDYMCVLVLTSTRAWYDSIIGFPTWKYNCLPQTRKVVIDFTMIQYLLEASVRFLQFYARAMYCFNEQRKKAENWPIPLGVSSTFLYLYACGCNYFDRFQVFFTIFLSQRVAN